MTTSFVVTNGKAVIEKDPQAVLDYPFDWTAFLADIADTISTKSITAEAGITIDSSIIVGTKVIVWLSGGTAGVKYKVTCHITTLGGRQDDRSFYVKIKDK